MNGFRKIAIAALAFTVAYSAFGESRALNSPDGSLTIRLTVEKAALTWSLERAGKTLVAPSPMGLNFVADGHAGGGCPLGPNMRITGERRTSSDTTWTTTTYRRGTVRDHYNELSVDLVENTPQAARVKLGQTERELLPRKMTVVLRAYDEGAAFRYVVPEQKAFDGFQLLGELTEWRFGTDVPAWTTQYASSVTGQEDYFKRSKLSEVNAKSFVGMPVLVENAGSTLALCEAALSNWAGLFYKVRQTADGPALVASLAELPPSEASTPHVSVIATTPAASPWRVAIVGDNELDLLTKNDILVNLNPPPDPALDFSWVKAGASSWDWWVESNNSLSTEKTIELVDFAAEMGWPYHTIDGGWYGFARRPNHGPNVPLEPRKDFDLTRIVRHARAKGVGIWVWIHWMEIDDTGIEETFARLEKWGVVGVKTDFLNRQDQWIVNWYERVCRAAARHHVMVNFHGAFKPTGTERTWPNNLTREGILGNEFNKFGVKFVPTPTHGVTLPFTRFLLGPGDFTPGSFANVHLKDYVPQSKRGHRYGDETDRKPVWAESIGTRAFALAQCVAYDSGLMTLCDWPERYRGAAGVDALKRLPASWKRTLPVAGKCGEYYAVVREAHDGTFYFAALTAKRRNLDLKLDFLGAGDWTARLYADDTELTPGDAKALDTGTRRVTARDTLQFTLLNEGGVVVVFTRN